MLSVDKVSHAGAYFVLTVLGGWGWIRFKKINRLQPGGWWIAAVSSLYGVGMEVLQLTFFPYRHFELYDILANIIGSIVGLFVLKFFYQ